MTITSRFNRKTLRQDALYIMGFIATFVLVGIVKSDSWTGVFLLLGCFVALSLVFIAIAACELKSISIWGDQMEVHRTLLPFLRRTYRFAEFDYAEEVHTRQGDELRLVLGGRRELTIANAVYANYDELTQAIRVPSRQHSAVNTTAEVVGHFKISALLVCAFWGMLALGCLSLVLHSLYVGDTDAREYVLMAVMTAVFIGFLLFSLLPFKFITVWNGQVDVRRLLWPFRVQHFRMSDIDGCYYVTTKADGRVESELEGEQEERWLVRDNHVLLSIPERCYANFEELRNATQTKFLGHLELSALDVVCNQLGKEIKF